jgi:transposase
MHNRLPTLLQEVIMYVELYHCSSELRKLARKEKNSQMAAKLRAICLALDGKSAPKIAEVLGYSRRSIQNWLRSYNHSGLEGLKARQGRGTKSRLNTDQLQWLRQRIEQGPTPDDGVCVLHAADIGRIIAGQFGISYSVRQVQRLLRSLGYRYISGRPEHPKGDKQAREAFKKKLLLKSKTSTLSILERI